MVLSAAEMEELAILEEMERRNVLFSDLFDKQQAVLTHPAKKKAIHPGRRGGKSVLMFHNALDEAQRNPGLVYPYIAKSQKTARWIAWAVLQRIGKQYDLRLDMKNATLEAILPNSSRIALFGSDREDLQDTVQGAGEFVGNVYIDEAALWRTNLERFIKDALEPILMDRGGTLIIAGAPNDVMAGYFYQITQPQVSLREPGWEVFHWTAEDNPHMKAQYAQKCAEFLESYGPGYQEAAWFLRQYRGLWVPDLENSVYKFDSMRNTVPEVPAGLLEDSSTRLVLGMDTGWSDGMAYVVTAYNQHLERTLYVLESFWEAKTDNDEIAARINGYRDKYAGHGMHLVIDPNNAQLNNDLRNRYRIPLDDAEKVDKKGWIRSVNTELEKSRLMIVAPEADDGEVIAPNESLTRELSSVKRRYKGNTWEEDSRSGTWHCCDALLYAFRCCYPYLFKPRPDIPKEGTPEWVAERREKMMASQRRKGKETRVRQRRR